MSNPVLSVIAFAVVLGLLILVHELGHFITAKRAGIKVEEFGIGYPPRIYGIQRGETIYSINAIPLGGFVKMLGEEDPTHERSFARAGKLWRMVVLTAGAGMNLLMGVLLFSASFMVGWPTPVATAVEVASVLPDSPAEAGGLRSGDVIVAVGGQQVNSVYDIRNAASASAGRDLPLAVTRDGARVELTVRPRADGPNQGTIGVSLREVATKKELVAYPPHVALLNGAKQTAEVIVMTFYVPVLALRHQVPADAARPIGPVGIFGVVSQATSETVARNWWFPLLSTAGLLSTGLGIANLLPIPGLDGGRLLFVALEAIRRRRVSPEREGLIHLVGIAFLLSLVVLISYYDLLAPIGAIDWGP